MSHLRGESTKTTALHLLCIFLTLMEQLLPKSQKQASHTIAMFVVWAEPSVLSNFSELAHPCRVGNHVNYHNSNSICHATSK